MQNYNTRVIQKKEISPGNIVLRLEPIDWKLPAFKPGQYGVLGLYGSAPRHHLCNEEQIPTADNRLIKRAYAIVSSASAKGSVEFYVSVVRTGQLTPRLYALEEGHKLYMDPNFYGMMTLDSVSDDKSLILMATGTGIAPYVSMLRTIISNKDTAKNIAVIHGASSMWDLGYAAEMKTLENFYPNFTYIPVILEQSTDCISGKLQNLWQEKQLQEKVPFTCNADNCHLFLSGEHEMIDSMEMQLKKDGFEKDQNLHFEKYW
jgi:ferredoxin--NADP+ reductase